MRGLLVLTFFELIPVYFLSAATFHFTPTADAGLYESVPGMNFGTGQTFDVGGVLDTNSNFRASRALLKFDLREIPTNSVIGAVNFSVEVFNRLQSQEEDLFEIRRVLVSWEEQTATWNRRSGDVLTPSLSWQVPGASGPQDASFKPSSGVSIGDRGRYKFPSTFTMISDVQDWINNPLQNHGWLLRAFYEDAPTARRFGSGHNPSYTPRLTVLVLPSNLQLTNVQVAAQNVQFQFPVESNVVYSVEFKDVLQAGSWSWLTNFVAQASTTAVITDPIGSGTSRFYRVSVSAQ